MDIARGAVAEARRTGRDVVIVDTAGRLDVDQRSWPRSPRLPRGAPVETLLVVDAMSGQEAVAVAQSFRDAVGVTGLVLTKVDGDARGGAALSISSVTGLPVKFMGTGEKTDELEVFHPDRLAGRILGMGDIVTLVERAQETFDSKQAEKLADKMRRNNFTLEDFLDQMQQVKKMGPLAAHGDDPRPRRAEGRPEAARRPSIVASSPVEAIIRSMTPAERNDPAILNASRRRRIARGSGTSLPEVNRLIKQFGEMQRMIRQMNSRGAGGKRTMFPMGPS